MNLPISIVLFGVAAVGLLLWAVQVGCLLLHFRAPVPMCTRHPGITVLKPLCGIDDGLMSNLRTFAELDYPSYEVLLGVKDTTDPAYPLARHAAACWPGVMRVVLQRGEPGLNPKVNQLITLSAHARHDLLVISDSNVAVPSAYLAQTAAYFEDPSVGIVTHPIAGVGERTLGSLIDNVHLTAAVSPGLIGAQRVGGFGLVVGKSMALRRSELLRIGGFEAVKDVLAEDYVLGRLFPKQLGKRIVVANRPVTNVSRHRSLKNFFDRYSRWSTMQRKVAGAALHIAQLALNPIPFALAGFAIDPGRRTLAAVLLCWAIKAVLEDLAGRAVRQGGFPLLAHLVLPFKDVLLLSAWAAGLLGSEVNWRGTRLAVLEGTRLAPVTDRGRALLWRRLARSAAGISRAD
jgi:ceramide glucosyltransferase